MSADYQLTPNDYLAIAKRWWIPMALTFVGVILLSVVVALLLPRVYESSGTLLAEAPQVAGEVVRGTAATGNAEQRVQALGRRIMTRESLLRIAAKHEVFDAEALQVMKDNDVVEAMRASIVVNVQIANTSQWERQSNNFAFTVAFRHGRPEKALEVTNALIQLFLESSVRERVEQASRANEFLSQEAERVRAQLEEAERRIAAYKRAQGGAPSADGQTMVLANIQTLEGELRTAEREHRQALNEIQTLQVELAGARSGVMAPGAVSSAGPSMTEQELDRARAELARVRSVYTEDHPDVRAQQRKVDALEKAARAEVNVSSPARDAAAAQARLAVSRLEAQLGTARARAELLADQQRTLRGTIGQLRGQLARAPQVERDLAALQRDYEATRVKYEDLRARQMSAQVVQNLEGEQQGERFTLLEPPYLAEYAIKPERKKLVAVGVLLGGGAAVAIAFLLEMLFARVRGVNALTALTGYKPMVVVPYISTTAETRYMALLRKRLLVGGAIAALIGLLLVHFFITPLHGVFVPLASRGA